ncbi:MAG: hypothetical protein AAFU67_01760, partial [Bacteroidota bacterium]
TAPPPRPKTPYELALERLNELEGKKLWQAGEVKMYYSELSYILRAYLEDHFKIPALESTTRQIDRALQERKQLNDTQRAELSELLQLSDLVKFAKAEPADDLHQRDLERVRNFVEDMATQPDMTKEEELPIIESINTPIIEPQNEEE